MYTSTRGIVFRQTRYSDTSLIVKIFTEELGIRSYLIKGARGPKSRLKASLFQPLSLLELVVSDKEKSELHHIREARVAYPYRSIPTDILKSSILLFLNELVHKSIQEESANRELFGFIFDRLVALDRAGGNVAQFHLVFAIHLTHFLGFFPQGKRLNEDTVFDLQEGMFTQSKSLLQENVIGGEACRCLAEALAASKEGDFRLSANASVRKELLDKILLYYTLHLPISGDFKSHKVLHELFR